MIVSFLFALFIIISLVLAFFVLLQQGKGDMGLGGLGGGTQTLFGGSGGQTFFEKATWILGLLFMFGSLGLTVLKMRELQTSRIRQSSSAPRLPQLPARR